MHPIGHIEKLLEDTPEAYYWIGFLLADGHFSRDEKISLELAVVDAVHVERYAKFIGSNVSARKKDGKYRTATMNKSICAMIKTKFDIHPRKTYCPPDMHRYSFSLDLWFSLICGYLDGDGCIKANTGSPTGQAISFHVHSSWLGVLNVMQDKLEAIFGIRSGVATIDKRGYASLTMCKQQLFIEMKKRAMALKLPLLERKWNKIDVAREYRYERARRMDNEVREFFKDGSKNCQDLICHWSHLMSASAVYNVMQRVERLDNVLFPRVFVTRRTRYPTT